MNFKWILAEDAAGRLLVKRRRVRRWARATAVCTIQQAAQILNRSRRHVYRYIEEGVLDPPGKFLGEWLLSLEDVRRLAGLPKRLKRPPLVFQPLYPEYPLGSLNPYRDWRLILGRVLDQGGRREMAWIVRNYPGRLIQTFLREEGARTLNPRALRLWSLYFKVTPVSPAVSWRASGRSWGGHGGY